MMGGGGGEDPVCKQTYSTEEAFGGGVGAGEWRVENQKSFSSWVLTVEDYEERGDGIAGMAGGLKVL